VRQVGHLPRTMLEVACNWKSGDSGRTDVGFLAVWYLVCRKLCLISNTHKRIMFQNATRKIYSRCIIFDYGTLKLLSVMWNSKCVYLTCNTARARTHTHALQTRWTLHSTSLSHEPIFVGHSLVLLKDNPLSKSLVCSADTSLSEWRRFGDLRVIL
jgi:hypothetical protein